MNSFKPDVITFTIEGRDYTVEFNRESLKNADDAGAASNSDMGIFARTRVILYAGLKKHHPNITLKRAGEIIDAALDEGYGIEGFTDILEEFSRCYAAVFTQSGETKKKLTTRQSEVTD